VIEFRNVSVGLVRRGRGESETLIVDAVAVRALIGVRNRILIQGGDNVGIDAGPPGTNAVGRTIWIHGSDLRRAKGSEAPRNVHRVGLRMGVCVDSLDLLRSCRAERGIRTLIHDDAVAESLTGHLAKLLRVFARALAFVGEEEKQAILLDGTAKTATKGV